VSCGHFQKEGMQNSPPRRQALISRDSLILLGRYAVLLFPLVVMPLTHLWGWYFLLPAYIERLEFLNHTLAYLLLYGATAYIALGAYVNFFIGWLSDTSLPNLPFLNPETAIIHSPEEIARVRKCFICKNYKPFGVHHCSTCGRCIPGMDHHCIFLNNCVGDANVSNFVAFLVFVSVGSFLVWILSLEHLSLHPDTEEGTWSHFVCSWLKLTFPHMLYFSGFLHPLQDLRHLLFTFIGASTCLGTIMLLAWQVLLAVYFKKTTVEWMKMLPPSHTEGTVTGRLMKLICGTYVEQPWYAVLFVPDVPLMLTVVADAVRHLASSAKKEI